MNYFLSQAHMQGEKRQCKFRVRFSLKLRFYIKTISDLCISLINEVHRETDKI